MATPYIIVFVTAKDTAQARGISRGLLSARLAACVNILEGVQSLFRWEGKIDEAREVLLVIKSRKKLFPKIVKKVKALHSYSVPEIIALPIIAGQKDYLNWIKKEAK